MHTAATLFACVTVASMSACARSRGGTRLDAEFRARLVAMNDALARADTAALRPRLADDLIWVIGASGAPVGKKELLAAAGTPQNPTPRFEIDSVHVRRVGDVAIVGYRRTDHRQVGGYEGTAEWRVFETYVRANLQWQVARHMQAWIRRPPVKPSVRDSASLVPFVGHYEIDSSYIDNVHFEGPELVATATGQTEGAHLVPVSETAFAPDGTDPLLVFERDSKGRVIGYVQGYPDGHVLRPRKID